MGRWRLIDRRAPDRRRTRPHKSHTREPYSLCCFFRCGGCCCLHSRCSTNCKRSEERVPALPPCLFYYSPPIGSNPGVAGGRPPRRAPSPASPPPATSASCGSPCARRALGKTGSNGYTSCTRTQKSWGREIIVEGCNVTKHVKRFRDVDFQGQLAKAAVDELENREVVVVVEPEEGESQEEEEEKALKRMF